MRPRDVAYGGDHRGEGQPEGQRYGQRVVGGPRRRQGEYGSDGDGGPAEDQDEGADQFGQRGGQDGIACAAAVEAVAL